MGRVLELFARKHLGASLVVAFVKSVVAAVLADAVGAARRATTRAMIGRDCLQMNLRPTDTLTVRRNAALRVCHSWVFLGVAPVGAALVN
ncbi:MAG: hypothetical protein ACI8Q9_000170 [Planctomycetota bacterium]|jgi:hypothetical protein